MKVKAKRQKIGLGIECTVYKVSDTRCYKKYDVSTDVTTIYAHAKKAYEAGIGPKVYRCNKNGYYTEIVEVLADYGCQVCDEECSCCEVCDKVLLSAEFNWDDLGALKSIACDIFGDCHDLHAENVGIKDNKLILIDFGKESL